jgi:hypothetical protein
MDGKADRLLPTIGLRKSDLQRTQTVQQSQSCCHHAIRRSRTRVWLGSPIGDTTSFVSQADLSGTHRGISWTSLGTVHIGTLKMERDNSITNLYLAWRKMIEQFTS